MTPARVRQLVLQARLIPDEDLQAWLDRYPHVSPIAGVEYDMNASDSISRPMNTTFYWRLPLSELSWTGGLIGPQSVLSILRACRVPGIQGSQLRHSAVKSPLTYIFIVKNLGLKSLRGLSRERCWAEMRRRLLVLIWVLDALYVQGKLTQ
jgi:hypothetical protein